MRTVSFAAEDMWAAIVARIGDGAIVEELRYRQGLLAPCAVLLPRAEAERIGQAVSALCDAFAGPAFAAAALKVAGGLDLPDFRQTGWILGFDFHLTPDGPQLIEINTNPGGLLVVAAQARALAALAPDLGEAPVVEPEVVAAFLEDWRLCRGGDRPARMAIIDDVPGDQYLLPEFRLYRRLLQANGIAAEILDPGEFVAGRADMVYNRLVDFDLSAPGHSALAEAWRSGATVVSPDPRSHFLYSDKRVQTLLCDAAALLSLGLPQPVAEAAARVVPTTVSVTADNQRSLWAGRRRWFFKPAKGHAGKAVYRGDKVTTGAWSTIVSSAYVAQSHIPPSRLHLDHLGGSLKMDLRANVRQGRVVQLAARLYEGQTTNFRTAGGGFAPVFVV